MVLQIEKTLGNKRDSHSRNRLFKTSPELPFVFFMNGFIYFLNDMFFESTLKFFT
jgi:hypothetical protein